MLSSQSALIAARENRRLRPGAAVVWLLLWGLVPQFLCNIDWGVFRFGIAFLRGIGSDPVLLCSHRVS